MEHTSDNLTETQFKNICDLIHDICGIHLKSGKEALVKARITKRLRALKIKNVSEYIKYLDSGNGSDEIPFLVDVMTTNKTNFFREITHFDYLRETVLPQIEKNRIRFWSAACSSGQEAYSLAITLRENIPDIDKKNVKILATDISKTMIDKADKGVYRKEELKDLPQSYINKYFFINSSRLEYRVKDIIRSHTKFAILNLIDNWPMKGPFDVIFCRNVMIYFNKNTQEKLVNRFWKILEPGGYLFVGHSEGLSGISHKYTYINPAVYRKQ